MAKKKPECWIVEITKPGGVYYLGLFGAWRKHQPQAYRFCCLKDATLAAARYYLGRALSVRIYQVEEI